MHRWRWGIHLAGLLGEALLLRGDAAPALAQVEQGLARARATSSMKYVARLQALRGEIAFAMGDPSRAERDLVAGLRVARDIGHPTVTWQTAHALSRVQRALGRPESAREHAILAADTISWIAARAPSTDLRRALFAWPKVQAALEARDAT